MKKSIIAALIAGQLLTAAQPAFAAGLTGSPTQQMGAFAGFRLRVPLDGNAQQRQIRAGLTLAPTMHSRMIGGESRLRIGEGLELGMAGGGPARLSLAGTPVSQLAQGPRGPDGRRLGVSTAGWIGIGAGTVVVLVGGFYLWLQEASECGPREC